MRGKYMNKAKAVNLFEQEYKDLYIKQVDYWTAQLAWTEFVDNLCRRGEISQYQFDHWETPFPYGKHLKPNKHQLEMEVGLCTFR